MSSSDFVRIHGELPSKCENRKCREPFFKEDVKGRHPIFGNIVNVICECHKCRKITTFPLPSFLIHVWMDVLPSAPPIDFEDIVELEKKMENTSEFLKEIKSNLDIYSEIYKKLVIENDQILEDYEEFDIDEEDENEDIL